MGRIFFPVVLFHGLWSFQKKRTWEDWAQWWQSLTRREETPPWGGEAAWPVDMCACVHAAQSCCLHSVPVFKYKKKKCQQTGALCSLKNYQVEPEGTTRRTLRDYQLVESQDPWLKMIRLLLSLFQPTHKLLLFPWGKCLAFWRHLSE